MITSRDQQLLQFLTAVRYATTRQIIDTIFPSVNKSVAYKRLDHLIKCKMLNRKYYNVADKTNVYVYYLDKKLNKKNVQHELLVTQYYVSLKKLNLEILSFEKTPLYKGIKPDAIIEIKLQNGDKRKIFLEVQLSKHDCQNKYFNLYKEDIPGILYIVTNNRIEQQQIRNLRIVVDDLKMHKLQFYFS